MKQSVLTCVEKALPRKTCFLASCFSSLLIIYYTPLNIIVVGSCETSCHYCHMCVQPPSALTLTRKSSGRMCYMPQ